jgi:hypothetical protein
MARKCASSSALRSGIPHLARVFPPRGRDCSVECTRTMKERGLDWTDEYQLREFADLYVLSILGTVRMLHFGLTQVRVPALGVDGKRSLKGGSSRHRTGQPPSPAGKRSWRAEKHCKFGPWWPGVSTVKKLSPARQDARAGTLDSSRSSRLTVKRSLSRPAPPPRSCAMHSSCKSKRGSRTRPVQPIPYGVPERLR